jgi:hypothetical protein
VQQLDAGDCDCRGFEPLEAQHWTDAELHPAMILLDQVVQVFR